jgi:O-antigen/teichoic acid export membrane protein
VTALAGAPRRIAGAGGRSLVRNSLLLVGTTGANLALGYVFWLVAARTFTVEEVGLGAAVIAALTLCGTIGAVGVGNALIQLLPTRRGSTEWSRTLTAGVATGVALSLAVGVAVLALLPVVSSEFASLHASPLAAAGFLAAVAVLVTGDLLDRAFVAERASGRMLARNATVAVAKIALLVVPAVVALRADGIVVAWVVAAAASVPVALALQRGLGRTWNPFAGGVARESARIVRTIASHHFVSVGNMAPQFVLPILVAAMLSTAENGVFYTSWRVAGGFMIISVAVATSLFAEGSHDPRDVRRNVWRSLRLIGAVLVPVALGTVAFGHEVLGVLGPEYVEGFPLLVLLAIGAFPDAVTNVYVAVLRLERRFRLATALTASIALVMLALTAVLLPVFGIAGFGVAFIAAQTFGCAVAGVDRLRRRRLVARPAPAR